MFIPVRFRHNNGHETPPDRLPLIGFAWIGILAGGLWVTGQALAALVILPPASLLSQLPPGTAILPNGPWSVMLRGGDDLVGALYQAGARLVLPAGLAGSDAALPLAFRAFAPSLLPIALAYHFAHNLPSLLVDAQTIPIVLNDPFGNGANLLGLGPARVSLGFFNRLDTVRLIWLAQAGAVVAGHVLAVLMAHVVALRLFAGQRRAALGQLPMAGFMLLYTLFGLWLLASPHV